ncbi:MAG: hypothetical protein DRJ38_05985 [Thermoprotei archaeon]|nr:MAG: hypothetical protein DRJ38_05985 [Thermoprotei archaeon]
MALLKHLIVLFVLSVLASAFFVLYLIDYEIYGGAYLMAEPIPEPENGDVLKLGKEDLNSYPDLKAAIETGEPQLPISNIFEVLGSRDIVEIDGEYYRVCVLYWDAVRRRPRFMYVSLIFTALFIVDLLYVIYKHARSRNR